MFRLAVVLLAALLIIITAGCSDESSDYTLNVTFGPRFMKIAQTTPEEWCEYLKESGPDFLGEITITGKGQWKSVNLVDYDGSAKWVYFAKQKLEELKEEFPTAPERCKMYIGTDYESIEFYYDHSVSPQIDEDILREAKTWCAFMQIVYLNSSNAELVDVRVDTTDCHRITIEDVLAASDLTEEDFAGIDPKDFFDTYEIFSHNYEENLNLFPDLLMFYREDMKKLPTVDYSAVYALAYGTLAEEDLDNIEIMIFESHEDIENKYVIIDFSENKVYSSRHSEMIECCSDSYLTSTLTQADREWIREVLAESGITSWKNRYIGTSEGTTGHFGIGFDFRLTDGRCVSYSAGGVYNSGMPMEMLKLNRDMCDRFFEEN